MAGSPGSNPAQTDLARSLESAQEWVSRYDNKASILLGIDIAMLGFLASSAPPRSGWTNLTVALSSLAIASLTVATVSLLWSNLPRTKPPRPSLHFFGTIASMKENDFVEAIAAQTSADRTDDLARQVHRISTILNLKFRALKVSYWATLGALAPWSAALILFRIGGAA